MRRATNCDESNALDLERGITTRDAAQLLGCAEITLRQRMVRGESPPFFRIGRSIRFRLGDVVRYRDARTVGRREP
jgi:predicted DNA-binding transcriptional regulator AlpA